MNEEKYICHKCVAEDYVRQLIKRTGKASHNCSYCNRKLKNVELEVIAEMLHRVFSENYQQPEDGEGYDSCGDSGVSVIQEELKVDEKPAEDIFSLMQETYNDDHGLDVIYDECFNYKKVKRTDNSLGSAWEDMEISLKSEARYFNQYAKNFLDELFSEIESMTTSDDQKAINNVGTNAIFYRARVFENYEDMEDALEHPELFFGPPPQKFARSGRMNAHGIPVFYGATSPDIAIAEVRPVVGDFVVVVAFRTLRELKIFNISSLNNISSRKGSIFDVCVVEHNKKASFMRTLARKLTMPVSGKKTENEYLITQAVSEYLAVSDKFCLDGISFDSTQYSGDVLDENRGHNVVLFNKSSKIINSESDGKTFVVRLFEDYEYGEYYFSPTIFPYGYENKKRKWPAGMNFETNSYALELIPEGIFFHEIKGVKYEYDSTEIKVGSALINKESRDGFDLDDD